MKSISVAAVAVLASALTVAASAAPTKPACKFRIGGALPDPVCTPGATNPAVTQATLGQTICVSGWTSTVRPAATTTEPQKFAAMRAYGIPTSAGHAGLYEYDHLVPLELGGAVDDPRNLWPEPHRVTWRGKQLGSLVKDTVENHLNALVCAAKLPLSTAQAIFEHDWRKGLTKP